MQQKPECHRNLCKPQAYYRVSNNNPFKTLDAIS